MEFLKKYSPVLTLGILIIAIIALIIGQFRDVREEIKEVRSELTAEIKDVRTEVKDVRTELTAEIKNVRAEVKAVRTELTVRMDRTDAKIDRLNDKMNTLILSLSKRKPANN